MKTLSTTVKLKNGKIKTIEVEIENEIAEFLTTKSKKEMHDFIVDEYKRNRNEEKETRRHLSLDMLMELEAQQKNWGGLENDSLMRNQETFSLISRELDPLEILIQREHEESRPIFKALSPGLGLTDYQRQIAVEFYINNKTHAMIAKELGISRQAVSKIIKKVRIKVIDKFI